MEKIYILGVGPGDPAYLLPAVVEKAAGCDVLVGGKRNLALFKDMGSEKIEITGRLAPVMEAIREKSLSKKVGVLVSGDSGIFSLLPRLVEEFGRENLEVYPGISAGQYFFARLGRCWHDALIVSLHGRPLEELAELAGGSQTLLLFTDPEHTPALICRRLVEAGIRGKKIYIGENLSYPDEKISAGRPEDFTGYSASDLNLVLIEPI